MDLQSLDLDVAAPARRRDGPGGNGTPGIRVIVCDAQPVVREGLQAILARDPDLKVAGQASSGEQAMTVARRLRPSVVIMDHRIPAPDGIEATRQLAGPHVADRMKVLLLVAEAAEDELVAALQAGARGLLRKDESANTLVQAVHVVAAGGVLLATRPSLTAKLLDRLLRNSLTSTRLPPALAALTARELEVLRLVAKGYSNRVIAQALSLCEATVKSHLHHLSRKLDVRDRTQAVVLAYETGLIRPSWDASPAD